MSPFNAQGKRQTAFAAHGRPVFDEDDDDVEIDDKDLRIDTYRSSGAGGQHVNVTDSAVRITHLPTGIVVSLPERAQPAPEQGQGHADPARPSWPISSARSARPSWTASAGETKRVDFGSQIRSYVLQPYQMVKDLRTEHEVGNVDGVLDGDLDEFMEAYLRWQRAGSGPTQSSTLVTSS